MVTSIFITGAFRPQTEMSVPESLEQSLLLPEDFIFQNWGYTRVGGFEIYLLCIILCMVLAQSAQMW